MKIFLICPVTIATDEQKNKMDGYVEFLEEQGHKVYYPPRDTKQEDETGGYRICLDNAMAIQDADEIHIFWDKNSKGSLFDLGVSFAYGKTLYIVNPEDIEPKENKSFENMICYWQMLDEQEEMSDNGI